MLVMKSSTNASRQIPAERTRPHPLPKAIDDEKAMSTVPAPFQGARHFCGWLSGGAAAGVNIFSPLRDGLFRTQSAPALLAP